MAFGLIINALSKLARVALAAMLLVVVPLADAATCVGEETQTVTEIVGVMDQVAADGQVAATSAEDPGAAGGDQHCIHGHCHHGIPYKTSDQAADPINMQSRDVFLLQTDVAVSRVASGLDRPPRV